MTGERVTEPGSTGELTIESRSDGWYLASSTVDGDTKCLFGEGLSVAASADRRTIEATVSSFRWGSGDDVNFVRLRPPERDATQSPDDEPDADDEGEAAAGPGDGGDTGTETWDLRDFEGTGEYVTVEATIDSVHMVAKDERNMPDVKGWLIDDSIATATNPVYFVIEDGVTHPYLEEGSKFRFENVKDHYYQRKGQVQVLVTEHSRLIELS